jgi:hypothetical protein
LRQSELNHEGGGVVKVYHSVDLEQMRRETLIGFSVWVAANAIEALQTQSEDTQRVEMQGASGDIPAVPNLWRGIMVRPAPSIATRGGDCTL